MKYKSLSHESQIPGLQYMKLRYPQKVIEDMHDIVPEII